MVSKDYDLCNSKSLLGKSLISVYSHCLLFGYFYASFIFLILVFCKPFGFVFTSCGLRSFKQQCNNLHLLVRFCTPVSFCASWCSLFKVKALSYLLLAKPTAQQSRDDCLDLQCHCGFRKQLPHA